MSSVPKATLYTFDVSLWASAPRLALIEKGYGPEDVDIKIVDLSKGENFDAHYLRLNSKGTVPTLVVPLLETTSAEVDTKFRALTDSTSILEFLDKSRSQNLLDSKAGTTTGGSSWTDDKSRAAVEEGKSSVAPAPVLAPATIEGKAISDQIIKLVHGQDVDANFLLLGARNAQEFAVNKTALPGTFVGNRHKALIEHLDGVSASSTTAFDGSANPKSSAIQENLKKWYTDKMASQKLLTSAYLDNDGASMEQVIALTNAMWASVAQMVSVTLESLIKGPYALGDQVSLADLHIVPWLARVLAIASNLVGGKDPLVNLDTVLAPHNAKIGPKLSLLWITFSGRPSFQQVYGSGLH